MFWNGFNEGKVDVCLKIQTHLFLSQASVQFFICRTLLHLSQYHVILHDAETAESSVLWEIKMYLSSYHVGTNF